jgi:hypothetical protein
MKFYSALLVFLSLPSIYAAEPARAEAPSAGLTLAAVLTDRDGFAGAHDIEIRDGIAYLAGKGGSIAIVDVRQPATPRLLWSVRDSVAFEDSETILPLEGNRLLVGTRDVLLFDVSQPPFPRLVTRLHQRPVIDTINGFARLSHTVYGANKFGHVFAVDVSVPDQLKFLGSRNAQELDGLVSPHDVAVCGEFLVVVSPQGFGRDRDRPGVAAIYRIADRAMGFEATGYRVATGRMLPPDQWTLVSKIEHLRLAGANRVMTRGKFAYIGSALTHEADRSGGRSGNVAILDLTDPAKPQLRGSVPFPDHRGPNGLEVAGSLIFAAGGKTVQVVDVADPAHPREVAVFSSSDVMPGGADDGHDLVYYAGHLFVTAQTSHALVVLKLSEELQACTRQP